MKKINLIEMLQGCSKRNRTAVYASNPDGQPTVKRQSRLMSHQGKAFQNVQMGRYCSQPDSVSSPSRCRVLGNMGGISALLSSRVCRYAAMLLMVLMVGTGQMWATNQTFTVTNPTTDVNSSGPITIQGEYASSKKIDNSNQKTYITANGPLYIFSKAPNIKSVTLTLAYTGNGTGTYSAINVGVMSGTAFTTTSSVSGVSATLDGNSVNLTSIAVNNNNTSHQTLVVTCSTPQTSISFSKATGSIVIKAVSVVYDDAVTAPDEYSEGHFTSTTGGSATNSCSWGSFTLNATTATVSTKSYYKRNDANAISYNLASGEKLAEGDVILLDLTGSGAAKTITMTLTNGPTWSQKTATQTAHNFIYVIPSGSALINATSFSFTINNTDTYVYGVKVFHAAAPTTKRIYMKCGDSWCNDSPKFFLRSWGAETHTVVMTQMTGCETDTYYGDIPSGNTGLLFTRQNSTTTEIIWEGDDFWGQSHDITIGDNDLFTCTGWSDGKGTFSGSTYAAPAYTISFNNGGGTGMMTAISSLACGANQAITANSFEKAGYSFANWTADVDVTVGESTITAGSAIDDEATLKNITSDITLTAAWTQEVPSSVSISGTTRCFPGQTISLTAETTGGTSDFAYQWQKYKGSAWTDLANGTDTDGGTFSGVGTANLQISGCTKSNSGSYRCVVSKLGASVTNGEGYAVHVYTLEGDYSGGSSWTSYDIEYTSGNAGKVDLTLTAGSLFEFGIKDNFNNTWYRNTGFIIDNWTNEGCGSGSGNCHLFTGPAGTYRISVDHSHAFDGSPYVQISVTYPEVTHPAEGYTYFEKPGGWANVKLYWYTDNDTRLTSWEDAPQLTNTATICGKTYYYSPLNSIYSYVIYRDNGSNKWPADGLSTTGCSGKHMDETDYDAPAWASFNTYSITFDKNGGTGTMSSINGICPGADQALTANVFTNTGHRFSCWHADVDVTVGESTITAGGDIADEATLKSINDDITLTAQWNPITYTIAYKDGESDFAGDHESGYPTTHTYGTETTLKSATKTGYTLEGWYTEAGLENKVTSLGATAYTDDITLYAKWTANEYTITYMDGESAFAGTHEDGYPTTHTYGTATTLKGATKTGYTLEGWYTEAGLENKVTSLGATAYTANITLYAKWYPIATYTFKCTDDKSLSQLESAGWSFNSKSEVSMSATGAFVNLVKTFSDNSITVPGSDGSGYDYAIALAKNSSGYARFDLGQTTTVTALTGNIRVGTKNEFSITVKYLGSDGSTVKYIYTKAHSKSNWGTNALSYTTPVADVRYIQIQGAGSWQIMDTLRIKYVDTAVKYDVTYKANGGTGDDIEHNVAAVEACTFTAPSHKHFTGWNTDADGEGTAYAVGATVSSDLTLYAQWAWDTYTISFAAAPAGAGTVSSSSIASVEYGSEISINGSTQVLTLNETDITPTPADATAEYTYSLGTWDVADGDEVSGTATYTHTFTRTANNYTLAWDKNGSGDALSGTYDSGTTAFNSSITAPNDPTWSGYRFDGWNSKDDGSGDDYTGKMPAANTTYYAQWTALYSVTHTLTGCTATSGDTGSGAAANGEAYEAVFSPSVGYTTPATVSVTIGGNDATVDEDYTWTEGTGTLSIAAASVTGAIVITVEYTEDNTERTVTYDDNEADSGDVPTEDDHKAGSTFTVKDNTGSLVKDGYTFRGWTCGDYFYKAGDTFTMPASAVTLTAVWDPGDPDPTTLVSIDFTESGWSSLNNTETAQTLTIGTQTVYVRANNTGNLPSVNTSTGTLTWGNRNFSNRDCYLAIPVTGVDGALTISVANGSSDTRFTYASSTSSTVSNPSSVASSTSANPSTVTLSNLSGTFYMIYLGRQGSTLVNATSITITTPVADTHLNVAYKDGNKTPDSHTTWPDNITGVPSGKKILQPTDPTATGYTFGGWYADAACTSEFSFSGTITKDTTIYAKWTAKTTTVTIDANTANHGSTAPSAFTATYGQELPEFTAATGETGYQLIGYYDAATSGTKVIDADGTFSTNDGKWNREDGATLTLYAQYGEMYSVTYKANNGTEEEDVSVTYEPTFAANPSFTAPSSLKAFGGWNTKADGTGTHYDVGDAVTEATTVYAEWWYKVLYIADAADESNDVTAALEEKYVLTKREAKSTFSSSDYTDFALVVLSETLNGGSTETANHELNKIKSVNKPILNLKSYFYGADNDSTKRWQWAAPNAGRKTTSVYVKNNTYSNLTSHPIYTGLTPDGNDSIQLVKSPVKTVKPIQPLKKFVSGAKGYTLAVVPDGTAIHELTAAQRSALTGETITSKYLLVSLTSGELSNLHDNTKTLLQNAADYLITGSQWVPQFALTLDDQFGSTAFHVAGDGSKTVTMDANTNLTSTFTKPKREGYIFGGYYTEEDGEGTQIVDENGDVVASASDASYTYTDASKNWKYADHLTVYAKWTDDNVYVFIADVRPEEYGGGRYDFGFWKEDDQWSKGKAPSDIDNHEVILVKQPSVENVSSSTYTACAKNIKIATNGTYTCVDGTEIAVGEYPKLDIDDNGALVVKEYVRNYDLETETLSPTTSLSLHINAGTARYGSAAGAGGVLIVGNKITDNKAWVEFYTKAHKNVRYDEEKGEYVNDYINQYFGIPFDSTSVYDYEGIYLYAYDAETNSYKAAGNKPVDPFKAYLMLRTEEAGTTLHMTGRLALPGANPEDDGRLKVLSLYSKADATASNMFANSWNGPLDIKAMTPTGEGADFVGVEPTFYLYNAGSKYDRDTASTIIGNGSGQWTSLPVGALKADPSSYPQTVIPPQQAFLLVAQSDETSATHTLTLDYYKHVYKPAYDSVKAGRKIEIAPTRAPKRTTTDEALDIIRMRVVGHEKLFNDRVIMYQREDFTDGIDQGWEGRKIIGSAYAPQMYAVSADGKMSINAVPDVEGTVIGFRKGSEDSQYTISFEYNGDKMWYLNDLKEQKSTLISDEETYEFSSLAGDTETRFVISATPLTSPQIATGVDGVDDGAKAKKVVIDQKVYIIRNGRMYDPMGKMVK